MLSPDRFSNSQKNKELSFDTIANNKNKEKKELRKRWLHMISQQNFTPAPGRRVCSKHFTGGRKTYMNNVPTTVPKIRGKGKRKRGLLRRPKEQVTGSYNIVD